MHIECINLDVTLYSSEEMKIVYFTGMYNLECIIRELKIRYNDLSFW